MGEVGSEKPLGRAGPAQGERRDRSRRQKAQELGRTLGVEGASLENWEQDEEFQEWC